MPEQQPFDLAAYHQLLAEIRQKLSEMPLAELEGLAIRLIDFHKNRGIPNDSRLRSFCELALDRVVSELLGFVGCLRAGSFLGVSHHLRAIIENHVNVAYMVCPVERFPEAQREFNSPDDRIRRYFDFRGVSEYNHFAKIVRLADQGLSDAECQRNYACTIENARKAVKIVATAEKDGWIALYRPKQNKISKIKFWHTPYSVADLMEWCLDPKITCPYEIYSFTSTLTHPNILFKRLFGPPHWSAGLPDSAVATVVSHIDLASVLARDTISMAQEATSVDTGILA